MKRIQLHWQILIALAIAIFFGLMFSTTYVINDKSFKTLNRRNVPENIQKVAKNISNQEFKTIGAYKTALEKQLNDSATVNPEYKDAFKKYKKPLVEAGYHNPVILSVSWLGDLFLRLLKMLILPLVLSSIISAMTNIGGSENLGRIGIKTLTYYVMTSLLAILTGLFLVNLIRPGVGMNTGLAESVEGMSNSASSLGQTLLEMIPTNVFNSINNGDMLPVIFFSILFGFFITQVGIKSRDMLSDFFNALTDVVMKITMFVIRFTPLGVFGIVSKVIADQEDVVGLARSMGLYMLTVLIGIAIHFFISLPLIVKFIGKAKPFKHMKNMATPLLTAFSTSSSGATLPLTMHAVEHNSGVSNRVASFTLPLGATINMDGTALYECVATLFIAQAYGIELTTIQQVIVVFTSLLASIGAAAVPMAGLFMMTVILTAVGLPLEGVGLILSVDRILDMFRTSTNVWSDMCGAVVIAKSEGETLKV